MPIQNDVNLSIKTFSPYKLADCSFKLDDKRAKKSIRYFGKVHYDFSQKELLRVDKLFIKDIILGTIFEVFGFKGRFFKEAIITKNIHETLGFVDCFLSNRFFLLKILEQVKVSQVLSKVFRRATIKEDFSVCDDFFKRIVVNRYYAIGFVDCLTRNVLSKRSFFEIVLFEGRAINETTLDKREAFTARDCLTRWISLLKDEKTTLLEELKRDASFFKWFKEKFCLDGSFTKEVGLNKCEAIKFLDVFLQHCNAVISNLNIKDKDMDLDKFFKETLKPPFYEPFVEFNVGDYEYKKALVRFVLESRATNAEPLLYAIATHVDIDDVDDRGTVNITDTSKATKVYFNKFYYNPPEVQVTLKGASTATGSVVPILFSTDKFDDAGRYFEIALTDGSNEFTTGIVSWVSKGY